MYMLVCSAAWLSFANSCSVGVPAGQSLLVTLPYEAPVFTLIDVQASVEHAKQMRYCGRGDCIVALHRIGNASVIKIVDIK